MAKIDTSKILVENNSIEEIIRFLADELPRVRSTAEDGIQQQNMGLLGISLASYVKVEGIIRALNEKLNGKKEVTVVQ